MKANSPERSLGAALRARRIAQNMRLADLAKKCGLSVSYLSQIERDKIAPSISSLTRIAESLQTNVSALFGNIAARPEIGVVRAHERKALVYPGATSINQMLTPDLAGALQMFWSMIDPGTKGPVLQHPTEECGVVIKGTLTVWVGDEKFILKPGDSIRFPGNLPHRYENNGKIRCESVWCMTPPGF